MVHKFMDFFVVHKFMDFLVVHKFMDFLQGVCSYMKFHN